MRRSAAPTREVAGVVVGASALGEADRLLRLLTPDLGRVSVVVRRARGRRGTDLGLGTDVQLVARAPREGLWTASAVEVRRAPLRARDALVRIALLSHGCDVAGGLAPELAPAEKLHGLLLAWLDQLERREPPVAARVGFEAKATTFAGLGPALVRCAGCGGAIGDPAVFDPESGGALHARCGGGEPVAAARLAELERLRWTPLAEIADEPVADRLLTRFLEHHLGRPLAARTLLEL